MLDERLFVELHVDRVSQSVLGWARNNGVAFFVVLKGLVNDPPPAVLFKQLNNQWRIIASADVAFVELEVASLKLEVEAIFSIYDGEQLLHDGGFNCNHELFRLENLHHVSLVGHFGHLDLQSPC